MQLRRKRMAIPKMTKHYSCSSARYIIPLVLSVVLPSMNYAATPPTEKKPVTDEYHGVKVVDDYRWLEDGGAPAVKAWTEAQNRNTRAYLDALPDRAAIQAQLTDWYAKVSP